MRQADLSPPLGWPGGLCHVVQRIEQEVGNPRLRDNLSNKVEHGKKLTNPEASKVYKIETERGGGLFRALKITPHAQYRMDQRGITVGDLRVALQNYSKQLLDWKSQRAWQWNDFQQQSMHGNPVEWLDKKLDNLFLVIVNDRATALLVTTYWEGQPDPRPETCTIQGRHARTVEDMSGYRTFVKNPTPSKSDTGDTSKDNGKYPTQGLPSPPWSRSKPTRGPTVQNVPGESGSDSDGTVHKDKVRTKGVPGGQYPGGKTHPDTPYNNTGITPNRRPGMTAEGMNLEAGMYPPAYPGGKRQREQKGQAKLYFSKRYRRTRGKAKLRQKRRHRRLRTNGRYKADRARRVDSPERFERRPGGGARTIAERGKKQRDKQKATPSKNKQDNRPKRASLPIPFFHYLSGLWGQIIEVSPCGFVHFEMDGQGRGVSEFDIFFDEVVVDEDRLDELFNHMDGLFEFSEGGSADEGGEDDDSSFESWLDLPLHRVAQLANEVVADFLREQRPPKMDPNTVYDRANDHNKRLRRDRKPGTPGLNGPHEKEVQNSNPGSRVLPTGKGHIDKTAALISDIREGCGPDLVSRSSGLKVRMARVDAKNAVWLFNVEGSSDPYRVRLKVARKGNISDFQKVHVKVSCSCPFWQWQGPEFHAKQGDYLYGRPVGSASTPDVKDPNGQHRACKHVLAVLDFITDREWKVPKSKRRAARYLVDSLRLGGALVELPGFDVECRRVAARYLASMEVPDA